MAIPEGSLRADVTEAGTPVSLREESQHSHTEFSISQESRPELHGYTRIYQDSRD